MGGAGNYHKQRIAALNKTQKSIARADATDSCRPARHAHRIMLGMHTSRRGLQILDPARGILARRIETGLFVARHFLPHLRARQH